MTVRSAAADAKVGEPLDPAAELASRATARWENEGGARGQSSVRASAAARAVTDQERASLQLHPSPRVARTITQDEQDRLAARPRSPQT